MNASKPYILVVVILLLVGTVYFINLNSVTRGGSGESVAVAPRASSEQNKMKKEEKSKHYELAKEITTPDGFINTGGKPITVGELVGKKVILVDFWTYSCINCQRTTPYLNAWYEKYNDNGLEIIGVHTPEFAFEKVYANVAAAVKKFGIAFPVVLDNDYSTWNAYKNRYWPRKYLIDIDGYIVYDHIGEGGYKETERKIQELLEERTAAIGETDEIAKDIAKPEGVSDIDASQPRSPEIYFGAARNTYLGNGVSGTTGAQKLHEPAGIKTNILYLAGDWNFADEFAENKNSGAKIIFRYQGKDVYMVASSENPVGIRIVRDGKALGAEAGEDIITRDGVSRATIQEDRLYKLIQDTEYGEHTIEIIIENPGLKVFTFTFG